VTTVPALLLQGDLGNAPGAALLGMGLIFFLVGMAVAVVFIIGMGRSSPKPANPDGRF
jgi:hypothetical protein